MSSITRRGIAAAATGLIVCASLFAGSSPARAAADSTLSVTAVAAPVWLSNNSMRVAYAVDNSNSQFFCQPATVQLVWASSGGRWHHKFARIATTGGVASGAFSIPGRTIWPGILRYKVKASQSCGLFMRGSSTFRGQSPGAGYSTATIR